MRVSKYRDRRTGVFYLNWGQRGDRHRVPAAPPGQHEGTKDAALAEEFRKQREREIALAESQALLHSVIQERVEQAVRAAVSSVHLGAAVNAEPRVKIPVERAIEKYLSVQSGNRGNTKAHVRNVELQLKRFIEHAKATNIGDLRREHLEDYLTALTGVTAKTRKDKLGIIAAWLRWAKGREYVFHNVADGIEPPRISRAEILFHTAAESRAILEAAQGMEGEGLVTIALFTGLRKSELLRLQGEWVHLEEREIVLPAMATKTRTRRIIPIFDQVLSAFLKLPREGKVFPFSARAGYAQRMISAIFTKVGIKGGLQSLRRSFVTNLLLNGVDLFVAARWAGHDAVVQQQRYAGLPGTPLPITYHDLALVKHGLPDVRVVRALKS